MLISISVVNFKFAAGVIDTGGKFAATVTMTRQNRGKGVTTFVENVVNFLSVSMLRASFEYLCKVSTKIKSRDAVPLSYMFFGFAFFK
jgi:hypothetical protein